MRHEHCFVFNENTKKIFNKTSNNENGIQFNIEELRQIQGARLFIHNHPKGDSFSSPDLKFMLENGIEEIRAYGKDSEYTLKLKIEIQDDKVDEIVEKYKSIIKSKEKLLRDNNFNDNEIEEIKYLLSMDDFMTDENIQEVFSYESKQ